MGYTTPQNVRDLLGVDIDTADDSILTEFIEIATELIRTYIQSKVIDEELSGRLDGINNTFTTQHTFWADVSGDTLITTADFTVYGWKDSNNPLERDILSVSTFDPLRGFLVLSSPPDPNTYEKITIDYSYYTKAINWKLLSLATAWKAAEIWVKREEFLLPESWSLGGRSIRQNRPWQFFEIEFNRIIDKIRAIPMTVVEYKKLVFRPRGPERPEVDTTAAKEIRQKGKYVKPIENGEPVN
jgi:hypothetical protein